MEDRKQPRCSNCKHLNENPEGCPAFPDGIPDDILSGKILHKVPIKGQVGDYVYIRFKLPPRIQELYDKNFEAFQYMEDGIKLTAAERRELDAYFRKPGSVAELMHDEGYGTMLIVSHPDYGKVDKYGYIKII